MSAISIRQLSGSLGAEIEGINLNELTEGAIANSIDTAFYEHLVLVFPNQTLSPAKQVAFTERFGAVEEHPLRTRRSAPGFPGVLILEHTPGRPGARNAYWHSAISHAPRPPRSHPVVRTHPHSGRKALFVNPHFTLRFDDMTDDESAPLLGHLYDVATRAEHVYRHRWAPGDVVMWDNRCAMHYGVYDYDDTMPRLMHRTTAAGEIPS